MVRRESLRKSLATASTTTKTVTREIIVTGIVKRQ